MAELFITILLYNKIVINLLRLKTFKYHKYEIEILEGNLN